MNSRENREGRSNNGFVAIAYSMGDHTTSSEEESTHTRRRLAYNRLCSSRDRASTIANFTTGSGEKRSSTTQASETSVSNAEKMEEDSTQASCSAKVARKDETSSSTTRIPRRSDQVSDLASTVLGNLNAAHYERNLEQAPRRRARTESILARIREIIQNRQLEREALRVAQVERDLQLQQEVEEALREPLPGQEDNGGHPGPDLIDPENNDDEIDHECVWTSDDSSSSSSSSTSTTSSSDTDYLVTNNNEHEMAIENPNATDAADQRLTGCARSLPLQLPTIRRHRVISVETDTSDSSMDNFPVNEILSRREHSPRVNNAQKEIDAIEEEESQPTVVIHPFSLGLMKKIDSLALPVPIKKYLNYQRNFC